MENTEYYKQKIKGLQSKYHRDQYNALLRNEQPETRIIAINLHSILLADLKNQTLIKWIEGDLYTEELTENNIELQLQHYTQSEVILHTKIGVGRY